MLDYARNMFGLTRLILIDSYKPGALQELRLDGPTNLNGVNGAGKTTLLRLIPLFFGESPSRLVPKSRVNDSFVAHYLPHDSSYVIFEYRRPRQTCQVVIYASPNEGGLCYRFVDKGFELEDFVLTDPDGARMPVSCRDLARHLRKKAVFCSMQLTARNDYRTVIQNLPHAKGTEMRQLITRFSFCDSVTGRRLQHIEKIVTGMFMRSTDFRDLREMLVSCIEEDRESITLDLRTDTLDDWCKEYRAYQHADGQREQMAELERVDEAEGAVRQELAELAVRVRRLASRLGEEQAATEAALREQEQGLLRLKAEWENSEREMKREQAETEARLNTQRLQRQRLEKEKAEWESQDITRKLRLYEGRETLRQALDQARQNHRRLLEKVNDIDAEFRRLRAEKEGEFRQRVHELESRIQAQALDAEREKSREREACGQREQALREAAGGRERDIQMILQELKETRGQLTSQLREIQADPELLRSREEKRAALDEAHAAQEQARDDLGKLDARLRAHRADLQHLEQSRRQLSERRQRIGEEEAGLLRHLEADAGTLLGFLREHHPGWTGHIAKLIKPELLLRDDLSPARVGNDDSFHGLALALEHLSADRAASEAALRTAWSDCRAELERLSREEARLDADLTAHQTLGQALEKERRALELTQGQCRARIKQLKEETASLERQIEASRRKRRQVLDERLLELGAELKSREQALAQGQAELREGLAELRAALNGRLEEIAKADQNSRQRLQTEIATQSEAMTRALADLDSQRLTSLARGGVDTQTLNDLEKRIGQLERDLELAERAAAAVESYRRWREHEWPRHQPLTEEIESLASRLWAEETGYQAALSEFESQHEAFKTRIAEQGKRLAQLSTQLGTLAQMLPELEQYPRLPDGSVVLDASHTLTFLQKQKHDLTGRLRELQKQLSELVTHLKRSLNQFPGTQPGKYCDGIARDIGLDAPDRAWLPPLREWYATRADELRRWLVMQANTFGSAVRNYQQALDRFDREIDKLSRRLAASIDRNIGFDKIEAIHARLISNVTELDYWQPIVAFTGLYDGWQRAEDMLLPSEEFADAVQHIAGQLQTQGRVETRLVNLLGLEITVTENGRLKRATHDEELRQISSHGLSYLILCVVFVALVNMIRRDQPVVVIWPMDELKDLHQMNIERLLVILNANNITLLSAFPDPDPEVLRSFKNRYEIYGYRELVEMVIDIDDLNGQESGMALQADV